MAKAKGKSNDSPRKIRPTLTPEAEEKQLIALAMDRAKEQLANGTASSSVICHFLKLGSMRERQELEKLKKESELMQAKIDALESSKHIEELYADAIKAMRKYQGDNSDG